MATAIDRLYGNPTVTPFAANSQVQTQLDTTSVVEEIQFLLTGTLTLAGYTAAPTAFVEAVPNLISNLRLYGSKKLQGSQTDTFLNTDAAFKVYQTRLIEATAAQTTGIGTANAAYQFSQVFKHHFGDRRSARPEKSFLNTGALGSFTLSTYWRDQTAMVAGGTGGTATLSNVQLVLQVREYQDVPVNTVIPFYTKESQRQFNIVASQNDQVFPNVPVGNILRRQTFKGMVGATNFADPSNAIFSATGKSEGPHVQLRLANSRKRFDTTVPHLQADDKTLYKVEVMPTGYSTFELSKNGGLAGALNLNGFQTVDNILDIGYTGGSTNTLQITDEEVIPTVR